MYNVIKGFRVRKRLRISMQKCDLELFFNNGIQNVKFHVQWPGNNNIIIQTLWTYFIYIPTYASINLVRLCCVVNVIVISTCNGTRAWTMPTAMKLSFLVLKTFCIIAILTSCEYIIIMIVYVYLANIQI